ncbi:MAG: hypothetical protein ACK4TA_17615 [Saprospiraceae bacterium]
MPAAIANCRLFSFFIGTLACCKEEITKMIDKKAPFIDGIAVVIDGIDLFIALKTHKVPASRNVTMQMEDKNQWFEPAGKLY